MVQQIYKDLLKADKKTEHLVLARLFKKVFGRALRTTEWGHLRKLINLYGAETAYWAILNSMNIDASGRPLVYVSKVCIGMLREGAKQRKVDTSHAITLALLHSIKAYKQPDWEKILDAKATPTRS